jgi:hypothetical protein
VRPLVVELLEKIVALGLLLQTVQACGTSPVLTACGLASTFAATQEAIFQSIADYWMNFVRGTTRCGVGVHLER